MATSTKASAPTDAELLTGLAGNWKRYNETRAVLKALLEALPKDKAASRARSLAKKASGHKSKDVRHAVFEFCLPAILKALPSRAPLSEDLEEFVVVASPYEQRVSAIVGRIPAARRLPIFEREIARGEGYDVERIAKHQLWQVPDATTAVLDWFAKEKRLREGLKLVSGSKNPRIKELARAFGKKVGKSPFTYVDPKVVRLSDYAKLDDISKAQWAAAATAYCGRKVKDPASFVKALEKDDLDASDSEMRHWKVLRDKKHAYDLWVVWVENGSFFEAGSKKRAPVHIVQDTFEPFDKSDAATTLASDLAAAVPKSLWKIPKKR